MKNYHEDVLEIGAEVLFKSVENFFKTK